MHITGIRLVNYRNYASLAMRPDEGLCVLTGENAAGKTNVLEAAFLCALGRSHRTARDGELVRAGEPGAFVGMTVDTLGGPREIEIRLAQGERKRVSIDKSAIGRSGELLGVLNVVMFAPEDLEIVKGGPGERRRFADMVISQLKPSYYYTLQQYNAALKQRNALLKDPAGQYPGALAPWDAQLARLGAAVMLERAEHVAKLAEIAATMHETLSDGKETLTVSYQPCLADVEPVQLIDALQAALTDSVERDLRYGSTTVGPHRDDVLLMLNDTDVRVFGSQGQQRTVVLSLKLAQLEILREERGEPPVLLLDDVFSELDQRRQEMLIIAVQGCQTFLTCTHLEELREAGVNRMQVYRVRDGQVTEE